MQPCDLCSMLTHSALLMHWLSVSTFSIVDALSQCQDIQHCWCIESVSGHSALLMHWLSVSTFSIVDALGQCQHIQHCWCIVRLSWCGNSYSAQRWKNTVIFIQITWRLCAVHVTAARNTGFESLQFRCGFFLLLLFLLFYTPCYAPWWIKKIIRPTCWWL